MKRPTKEMRARLVAQAKADGCTCKPVITLELLKSGGHGAVVAHHRACSQCPKKGQPDTIDSSASMLRFVNEGVRQ